MRPLSSTQLVGPLIKSSTNERTTQAVQLTNPPPDRWRKEVRKRNLNVVCPPGLVALRQRRTHGVVGPGTARRKPPGRWSAEIIALREFPLHQTAAHHPKFRPPHLHGPRPLRPRKRAMPVLTTPRNAVVSPSPHKINWPEPSPGPDRHSPGQPAKVHKGTETAIPNHRGNTFAAKTLRRFPVLGRCLNI